MYRYLRRNPCALFSKKAKLEAIVPDASVESMADKVEEEVAALHARYADQMPSNFVRQRPSAAVREFFRVVRGKSFLPNSSALMSYMVKLVELHCHTGSRLASDVIPLNCCLY